MTKRKSSAKLPETTSPTSPAYTLGLAKLESSGLTLQDAAHLGIELLEPHQTNACHGSFKAVASLKLNYLGLDAKPLTDWPGCQPFYRLRYLEAAGDFSAQLAKQIRYVQEPGTNPVAYYPNLINWVDYAQDTTQSLVITEGELKAAKACKEGFATIGLGGVHNFESSKRGIQLIDSLKLVDWRRRTVYLCFDSDYQTNKNVCNALAKLAHELERHGAYIYIVTLPTDDPEVKVGLDDFLVSHPDSSTAFERFNELLGMAPPLGLTKPLFSYNDRYAYVRDTGIIVNKKTYAKTAPGAFKDHLESSQDTMELVLTKDGGTTYKPVSAAAAWLKWPLRAEVAALTYAPGAPLLTDDDRLNTWKGWGCEAVGGDVTPFLELVAHLFQGAEPGAVDWFLRWCAYPIQHPGTKLYTSCLLYGIKHGTGKSQVGYTLGKVYGKNFTEISSVDLHSGFNEWAEGKQLVMGDDITGSNKRQDNDLLKKLITQLELRVNGKYVPSYTIPDCINYYFTANHPDAFFLEDDDRRHFIHEVTAGPLPEVFYVEYDLWLATGGAEAVFHYLQTLDLDGFNPAASAFKTHARARMIDDVKSDLGSWVARLLRDPECVLKVGEVPMVGDLFTTKQLLSLYAPEGDTKTTANGLGRELRRSGAVQACGGKPVKWVGGQDRFYALRNAERWAAATQAEVTEHLAGSEKKPVKKAKY